MFTRLLNPADVSKGDSVHVTLDGRTVACREGDSVAAALLAAGNLHCRETVVSGVRRGPFCMMGICYDCLVVIDGLPNQQGCMTTVRPGMRIESQAGARDLTP
jgi:predicted molibdopterin-dependent oxidoreductase YjgC